MLDMFMFWWYYLCIDANRTQPPPPTGKETHEMNTKYTLMLVDYDENDQPITKLLTPLVGRDEMVAAVKKHSTVAYKCTVTEEDAGTLDAYGCGEIIAQTNADEWLEDELKRIPAAKPEKHTVKRTKDSWGDWSADTYEYRGYKLRRHDDVPTGYFGRWSVWPRMYTTDTRRDCIRWIDKRIAEKKALLVNQNLGSGNDDNVLARV